MPEVLVFQHIEVETLGRIEESLVEQRITPRYVRTFAGEPIPNDLARYDGLILMGGPMGVYEEQQFPFLAHERNAIHQMLHANKPILGVCLGSQLLASALGARVYKNGRREIGWHTTNVTETGKSDPLFRHLPSTFMGYHWHGDIFDLPAGAESLAWSEISPIQAFRYGSKAYGVLFHMEVTPAIMTEMVRLFPHELADAKVDGQAMLAAIPTYLYTLQTVGKKVYDGWARLCGDRNL